MRNLITFSFSFVDCFYGLMNSLSRNPLIVIVAIGRRLLPFCRCVTPGVTIALRGSFDPIQIPRLDHDKIIPYLRKLSYDGQLDGQLCARTGRSVFDLKEGGAHSYQVDDGSCFHLVTVGIAAIRSRTPTSAGMLGVNPDSTQREYTRNSPDITNVMWSSMKKEFHISDRQLVETNLYFADHIYDIAEENARGQCTNGHSCKVCAYFVFFAALIQFYYLLYSLPLHSLQAKTHFNGLLI